METDAALASDDHWISLVAHNQRSIANIHLEDLILLEKDLIAYEKIAIIFLLYGNDLSSINAGIQNCLLVLRNSTNDTTFIHQWAHAKSRQIDGDKWREMIVEALCVAQSYHATDKLGLYKQQLEEVYFPYRAGTALLLNSTIKSLFLMAESMLQAETDRLIDYMREKGSTEIEVNSTDYLEIYLLHWIRSGLITVHPPESPELELLYGFFKISEIDGAKSVIECIVISDKRRLGQGKKSDKEDISSIVAVEPTVSEVYSIKRNTCGFALIVNQKEFRSPAQVPYGAIIENGLKDRTGTDVDCKQLKITFGSRGYKVVVKKNLSHIELKKTLEDIVDASMVYDSLIVCILSHGKEGLVFGSDCIAVKIKTIKNILASEKLLNKPKVLFIQACQGAIPQQAVEQPPSSIRTIETDGPEPEEKTAPRFADLVIALSTIDGFVSYRDREKGTWYINSVCEVLDQRADTEHMSDLLTLIINEVSKKRAAGELCLLPIFSSTLRKKLFLPKRIMP